MNDDGVSFYTLHCSILYYSILYYIVFYCIVRTCRVTATASPSSSSEDESAHRKALPLSVRGIFKCKFTPAPVVLPCVLLEDGGCSFVFLFLWLWVSSSSELLLSAHRVAIVATLPTHVRIATVALLACLWWEDDCEAATKRGGIPSALIWSWAHSRLPPTGSVCVSPTIIIIKNAHDSFKAYNAPAIILQYVQVAHSIYCNNVHTCMQYPMEVLYS
jgi:hypothetical protein